MISRIYVRCLTCSGQITVRVQIGHESTQPVTFPCPHCESELRMRLLLSDPPNVGISWEENCEEGDAEGPIVNIGAGFAISKDKLHQEMYFPSFETLPMLRKQIAAVEAMLEDADANTDGPSMLDASISMGIVPYVQDSWKLVQKAWRLHRTGRASLRDEQIEKFWAGAEHSDRSIEGVLMSFFASFHAPREDIVVPPLLGVLDDAFKKNPTELRRLADDLSGRWINDRIDAYVELLQEYFKGYGEFSQTLIYAKNDEPLGADRHASSSDFDATRMFYGNAFELLGSHLDFVAALFNIVEGRAYDQLSLITLANYRTINKANRTTCFSGNAELSKLVREYDSAIRNASHHRWFKRDARRENIEYRSGGTGALRTMTYADYLYRCNKLMLQIMALACVDLTLLRRCRKAL